MVHSEGEAALTEIGRIPKRDSDITPCGNGSGQLAEQTSHVRLPAAPRLRGNRDVARAACAPQRQREAVPSRLPHAGTGLLLFDLFFQVLGAGFGGGLLAVKSVLFVDGVGEDDSAGAAVDHLYAGGVVRMDLAHERHFRPARFLFFGSATNDVVGFRFVGDGHERDVLLAKGGLKVVFKAIHGRDVNRRACIDAHTGDIRWR